MLLKPLPQKGDPRRALFLSIRYCTVLGALFLVLSIALVVSSLSLSRFSTASGLPSWAEVFVITFMGFLPTVAYFTTAIFLIRCQPWAAIVGIVMASIQATMAGIGMLGSLATLPGSVVGLLFYGLWGVAMAVLIWQLALCPAGMRAAINGVLHGFEVIQPKSTPRSQNAMPKTPQASLPQISYTVAYFILPGYAYQRLSKIRELCSQNPAAAGPFFYIMACQLRKIIPNRADAELFRWNVGSLDDRIEYFVIVFPEPPPFVLTTFNPADSARQPLAPHFAGIFLNRIDKKVRYYVLGQSPIGGGTTLRTVTIDPMVNSNLGPGPSPDFDSFLATVAFRMEC